MVGIDLIKTQSILSIKHMSRLGESSLLAAKQYIKCAVGSADH